MDRRTYLIELRSREKPYMPSVAWFYPEDREGDNPPWRPVNAYDDGRKVSISNSRPESGRAKCRRSS